MPERHFPVRPDLDQLRHQAKDLLRAMRREDPAAKLNQAQFALAKSYGVASWPRMVLACRVIEAIWQDDIEGLKALVVKHPELVHEMASGTAQYNWGAPMAYAANLGRDRIIAMLHQLGSTDHEFALGRAMLQSKIDTAKLLHSLAGSPEPPEGALAGPAYTLSVSGTAFALEVGARVLDAEGRNIAPVDVVLETDSRNPPAKRAILELYAEHGYVFPDTPTMALHRGRIDLLEEHLRRDPGLLTRTFRYEEIFPPALGCHGEDFPRTTLHGATLLHLCVEFEELEIARWLLDHGMNVDVRAAVDADGFGGHTALFGAVVSYPHFWMNYTGGWASSRKPHEAKFAQLLLDRGADPNVRASLRETNYDRHLGSRGTAHRNVTPLGWGDAFSTRIVVSEPAMRLIADRGGKR